MKLDEARTYLSGVLNKNLRVSSTDGRLFWGALKCIDHEKNIILAHTYEYRQPSSREIAEAKAANDSDESVTLDMTSRYLGLVVIPGEHIVRVQVEMFASQMKDNAIA